MKTNHWHITYRGSLSSCNYDCHYCPFAKTSNTRSELKIDQQSLNRFVNWALQRPEHMRILFTPWGEALVRKAYQKALIALSHAKNITKVAIQTNLSCNLKWVNEANKSQLALWTTYHPSQVSLDKFIDKCHYLYQNNVRFSVGCVGLKHDFDAIQQLRKQLPDDVYLWINAYKDETNYYHEDEIKHLLKIDPLFDLNRHNHYSLNEPCFAGESSFMVNHNGDIQRCHFIKNTIANIYDADFTQALKPRLCTLQTCDCHIGYIHLKKLQLNRTFKNGMVERIPSLKIYQNYGDAQ